MPDQHHPFQREKEESSQLYLVPRRHLRHHRHHFTLRISVLSILLFTIPAVDLFPLARVSRMNSLVFTSDTSNPYLFDLLSSFFDRYYVSHMNSLRFSILRSFMMSFIRC